MKGEIVALLVLLATHASAEPLRYKVIEVPERDSNVMRQYVIFDTMVGAVRGCAYKDEDQTVPDCTRIIIPAIDETSTEVGRFALILDTEDGQSNFLLFDNSYGRLFGCGKPFGWRSTRVECIEAQQ